MDFMEDGLVIVTFSNIRYADFVNKLTLNPKLPRKKDHKSQLFIQINF